jgi:hypothetical protein
MTRKRRSASTGAPHCAHVLGFATSEFSGPIATMNNMSVGIKTNPSHKITGDPSSAHPSTPKYP